MRRVTSRSCEPRRARIHFGSVEGVKDACRQRRGLRLADELEQMMTNIRLALRMLWKTPVVTTVTVVSLALGIGANAAIADFLQLTLDPYAVPFTAAVGRLAQSLLYEMDGPTPAVAAAAALALAAVALGAGFVPAHRASRVDPMTALRHQ